MCAQLALMCVQLADVGLLHFVHSVQLSHVGVVGFHIVDEGFLAVDP